MENRSTDADVRGTAGFLCPTGAARALKDGLVGEPLAVLGPEVQAKLGESVERSAELSYINPHVHPMVGSPARGKRWRVGSEERLDEIGLN